MKWPRMVMLAVVLVAAVAALGILQGSSTPAAPGGRIVVARRAETQPASAVPLAKNPVNDSPKARFPTALTPMPPEFRPVMERSIFSAHHESTPTEAELASHTVAASSPDASLVLCGVVQRDDAFIALVEDVNGRRVARLSPGDSIGRGRVVRVDLDGVDYEVAGQSRRVNVGDDLTGATPAIASDDTSTTRPTKVAKRNKSKPTDPPPQQPNEVARASKDDRPSKEDRLSKDDRPSKKKDKGSPELPVELIDPARASKEEHSKKPKDKQAQETKVKGGSAVTWPGRID